MTQKEIDNLNPFTTGGIADSWIGKKVRIKKVSNFAIPSAFDFLIGQVGTIERYADTRDIRLQDISYLDNISIPSCIFVLKVEGYEKPIFAPIEFLEVVE